MPVPSTTAILLNLLVAGLFVGAGSLGLLFRVQELASSPVWPAAGVALAALARWRWRCLPGLVLGVLAHHTINPPGSAAAFAVFAAGNLGFPLLVLRLLQRPGWERLATLPDAAWFCLVAAVTGVLNALWGSLWVAHLYEVSWESWRTAFAVWAIGDGIGILCVAPLLLTAAWRPPTRPAEALALALLLAGVLAAMPFAPAGIGMAVVFLCLPPLIWAALRFGLAGTGAAVLATTLAIAWITAQDLGPFSGTGLGRMLLVQSSMIGVGLAALLLAVADHGRRAALAELASREALYRSLFTAAGDGVVLLRDGRIAETNPAALRLTGRSAGDLLNQRLDEIATIAPGYGTGHLDTPAGERRDIETSLGSVPGSDGRVGIAIIRDVTEPNRLEAQLRQGQKMDTVGQLAGGLAHDFNNMLTGILGNAELAAMLPPGDPRAKPLLASIVQGSDRAATLVRKLLGFARKGAQVSVPVDAKAVAVDAAALLAPSLGRRIALRQELPAEPLTIAGDATMLQNVMLNLGVNARDAMPDGGELTIGLRARSLPPDNAAGLLPGRYAELSVTDTGPGIPPELLPRIGEAFFTTKEAGKGTGLGLAGVKRTLADHGGALLVESQVGVGSTFCALLPLVEGAGPPAPPPAQPVHGSGTILLVDDDAIVREVAVQLIRNLGYAVVETADGAEGLAAFRAEPARFAAAIVDAEMPSMRGPDCIAAMHAIDPGMRAILASGFSRESLGPELRAIGACAFLHKPYRLHDLARALDEAVQERRAAGGETCPAPPTPSSAHP